jgi:uncharacterized protein (DUF697 family)
MIDDVGNNIRDVWDRVRWANHDYGAPAEPVRLTLAGLAGAGKKTLFNTLWGREVIQPQPASLGIADFGLFRLVELPCAMDEADGLLYALDDMGLIVYVINSLRGLQAEDFQWIARLRTGKAALLVMLNLVTEGTELTPERIAAQVTDLEAHLALRVLPIRATDPDEVRGVLMEGVLRACPELAVPLASQIGSLRHVTAQRLIRQSVVLSLAVSVEPLPLLDVTLLIGLHLHLLARLGALYGKRVARQGQLELALTVVLGLVLRFGVQTALKFVPWAGWLLSGLVGASATWVIGQAALLHYEEKLKSLMLSTPTDLLSQLGARLHVPSIRSFRTPRR